ncbi:MAG: GIY-YIG nuclease family protein [Saprospiraceae bacterium]
MYYLYILYSAELDKYYVGSSSVSIASRLQEHLYDHKGFTGRAKDWELKYWESYPSKGEAYARERQIKRWKSRKLIEQLIVD